MKSYVTLFSALLLLLPIITFAQGLQGYIGSILTFINTVLVPFLLGIAFLIFAINVIRFFVLEGSREDGREKAKALALYSVMAIVIIVVFWGVINVLSSGTGLAGEDSPISDYVERGTGDPYQWQPTGGASI